MKWTKEKPTKEGWYLIREIDLNDFPNVGEKIKYRALAELYPHQDYDELLVMCEQLDVYETPISEFDGFEFSDQPMPEPEE